MEKDVAVAVLLLVCAVVITAQAMRLRKMRMLSLSILESAIGWMDDSRKYKKTKEYQVIASSKDPKRNR